MKENVISLSVDKEHQFMLDTLMEKTEYENRSKLLRDLILDKYTKVMKNESDEESGTE
jgi:metal-responsive CopG/Arc/MetJ family transcriptional regulator